MTSENRKGLWIQTYTGLPFWPLDPRVEDINILDIAHALSLQCRYGGHPRKFYSVAEHSVLVSQLLPEELAFQGLMHDATEAYCVDVPKPLKLFLPDYQQVEEDIWRVVAEKFDIPFDLPLEVHEVDSRITHNEKVELMNPSLLPWPVNLNPYPNVKITGWEPKEAEARFLMRYRELSGSYHQTLASRSCC